MPSYLHITSGEMPIKETMKRAFGQRGVIGDREPVDEAMGKLGDREVAARFEHRFQVRRPYPAPSFWYALSLPSAGPKPQLHEVIGKR